MTRVEGYRPMFGELELREVFGPRFMRGGDLIDECSVQDSAGGGPGVLPPAVADPADECDCGSRDDRLPASTYAPGARPRSLRGWVGLLINGSGGTGRRLV